MKKIMSILLVLVLSLGCVGNVFADGTHNDIQISYLPHDGAEYFEVEIYEDGKQT